MSKGNRHAIPLCYMHIIIDERPFVYSLPQQKSCTHMSHRYASTALFYNHLAGSTT